MNNECILCIEDSKFMGLTECNHGPFCHKCIYKMRVISKNNSCPICKAQSRQIVISPQFKPFKQLGANLLSDKIYGDVFHEGEEAREEFSKLMELKCFVKISGHSCKNDKTFTNIAFLKKHLKEEHKRVLCDVCLDKKTCVLEEQKLYSQGNLRKHLDRGDLDQYGNIIFMHPYCGFCKRYFFDDDEFRVHINLEHYNCNVCGAVEKYRYYKDYDSLETHYKISHYICSDVNCLAKKFIAFRSAEELKVHKVEIHGIGSKKIDGKQLCGFVYSGTSNENEIIEIKDKEGINMEEQFLTLKKHKNRAISDADKQEDTVIDLRDFYPSGLDEDDHYHNAFILKHKSNDNDNRGDNKRNNNKKRNYVSKDAFEKQKPKFAKENQSFFFEELSLIKTLHMSRIHYDDFEDRLSTLVGKDDLKNLEYWRNKFNKRHLNADVFVKNFLDMMKKVSLKAGYEIFPHYLRTVQNQHARLELDLEFVKILKKIKMKNSCMLSRCHTYGQLFKSLLRQIEINLEHRIVDKTFSIKKPILRQKERLFQIIGVLRRVKIEEMGKMMFASNFGIEQDTIELIHEKIFRMEEDKIQGKLSKIPNHEFIDLYIFVRYTVEAIVHSENMHVSKGKIHEKVLEDFLIDHHYLEEQYGPKKEEMNLEEQVEYQKTLEEKNHKKKLKEMERKNVDMGYHAKADFNLNDKSDFPDLMNDKNKKKDDSSRENYKDMIENTKNKPATYQKTINEMFPSLEQTKQDDKAPKKDEKKSQQDKKQKPWWQQINQKNVQVEEEVEAVKVRNGRKKKQKWVSVKGFF